MSRLKNLGKRYRPLFDTLFVLAGIVANRWIGSSPFALASILIVLMLVLVFVRILSKLGKLGRKWSIDKVQALIRQAVARVLETEADFSVGAGFALLGLGDGWGGVFFGIYFGLAVAFVTVKELLR